MVKETFSSYYFMVEIDGIQSCRFLECSGIEAERKVYEVEEGGLNTTTHKFLGTSRYPNLVLKKGISSNSVLVKMVS